MKQNTKGGHLRFMSDEVVQKKGKRPAVRQNRWKEAGHHEVRDTAGSHGFNEDAAETDKTVIKRSGKDNTAKGWRDTENRKRRERDKGSGSSASVTTDTGSAIKGTGRWREAGNIYGSLSDAARNKSDTDVTEDTISLAGRSAERASEGMKQNIYSRKLKEYTEEEYRKAKDREAAEHIRRMKEENEKSGSTLSSFFQKRKIKKGYVQNRGDAQGSEEGTAYGSATAGGAAYAEDTAAAESAAGISDAAASKDVWHVILIIVIFIAAAALIAGFGISVISPLLSMTESTTGASSYSAADRDILGAEKDYRKYEKDLQKQINDIEKDHPGYDEYRYNLAEIGHDPYQLASFLTIKSEMYKRDEVKEMIKDLFEKEYVLTLTESVEKRTRTVTDPETGEEHEEEYDWHVLSIKLVNKGMEGAVNEEGLDDQERARYDVLNETKGNRDYLWGEDVYVPDNEVDTGDDDYSVPGEAMTDTEFGALYDEAKKYLGMEYVWGGSKPGTGFDCSGFVCWSLNHSGYADVGRTSANGLLNMCSRIGKDEAKPGDLIFFQGTYAASGASHVGIYLGDGRMIHCGNPIKISDINTNYWNKHYYTCGRIKDCYR